MRTRLRRSKVVVPTNERERGDSSDLTGGSARLLDVNVAARVRRGVGATQSLAPLPLLVDLVVLAVELDEADVEPGCPVEPPGEVEGLAHKRRLALAIAVLDALGIFVFVDRVL